MSWKSIPASLTCGRAKMQLEATKKGSSTTVSGLVFAAYSYVIFILPPIVGKYLPKLGKYGPEKKTFWTLFTQWSFPEGAGEIMFGFVSSLEELWLFMFLFISNNYCRWSSFITNCYGSDFMRSLFESRFTSIWNVGHKEIETQSHPRRKKGSFIQILKKSLVL